MPIRDAVLRLSSSFWLTSQCPRFLCLGFGKQGLTHLTRRCIWISIVLSRYIVIDQTMRDMKKNIQHTTKHRYSGTRRHEHKGSTAHAGRHGHGFRDTGQRPAEPQPNHDDGGDPRPESRRRHARHRIGKGRSPRDRARRGEACSPLLNALRDGPKHGYAVIKALEERSAGPDMPSLGTVYRTLPYLADQDAQRRVYHLTKAGQAALEVRHNDKDASASRARFAPSTVAEARRHEVDLLQATLDDLNRIVWRDMRDVIERDGQATLRRVRQSIEHCRNDIRSVIANSHAGTATQVRQ